MTRTNLILPAMALAVILPAQTTRAQSGITQTVVLTGDPAPDVAGTGDGTFDDLGTPLLNNLGQVAFDTTSISGSASTAGVFLADTTTPALRAVVRHGQLVPNPTSGTNGNFSTEFRGSLVSPIFPALNNSGQVLVIATGIEGSAFDLSPTGLFIGDGTTLNAVVRANTLIDDGGGSTRAVLEHTQFASLSDSGHVPVFVELTGDTADNERLYRGSSFGLAGLGEIAREGDPAPGGHTYASTGGTVEVPAGINANNHIAFAPNVIGQPLYRADAVNPASASIVIVDRDDPAPDAVGFIEGFVEPILTNNIGDVAFRAFLHSTPAGEADHGVFIGNATSFDQIIRKNQTNPEADGIIDTFFGFISLNNAGQVAFGAIVAGTPAAAHDGPAIYRGTKDQVTTIARVGTLHPGDDQYIVSLNTSPNINDHGQVLVEAFFASTPDAPFEGTSILIGDGQELIEVARTGQPLAGSTIASLDAYSNRSTAGRSPINDFAQVAYHATLDDGRQGLFLFTPQLHWRANADGDWDDNTNWTVSLQPSPFYDVFIDPSTSATILGPTTNTTLKSLQIGGGAGTATLALGAGTIHVTPDVTITPTGALTGDGTINTDIINHGTIIADNVHVTGSITNHNLITGDGTITAPTITNADGAELRALDNAITLPNGLTNQPGARIIARDSFIDFGTGLTNDGNLNLSFGTSDVFGPVTNNAGGRIIASGSANVVFYDDLTNNGNVQVSAGSTAVYFGDVDGTGSYTGGGTNFFEGTFSPGASPAVIDFDADLTLTPSATLLLELTHDVHDQLNITGHLHAAGTLAIALLDGYHPGLGETFQFLNLTTASGGFSAVNLPTLDHGLTFDTSALLTSGTITVVPEPAAFSMLILWPLIPRRTRTPIANARSATRSTTPRR